MCDKGQRKGSVYSSYWRPHRSMRVGSLATRMKHILQCHGAINTQTYIRDSELCNHACLSYLSYFSLQVSDIQRISLRCFFQDSQVFHFVCYFSFLCNRFSRRRCRTDRETQLKNYRLRYLSSSSITAGARSLVVFLHWKLRVSIIFFRVTFFVFVTFKLEFKV